jgi:NADP-dependent 3-hydroxy acid dehydrogenase YdfG
MRTRSFNVPFEGSRVMCGMLTNQIAVVTGASSGIGRAIALALGAQGATLCLLGRNVTALQLMAPRVARFVVDLSDESRIHEVAIRLQKELGGVDILIHSAGVFLPGQFELGATADFDLQQRINVRAPSLLTQELLPALQARRGQVVFINSSAARQSSSAVSQYAATKKALKAFADRLRDEVNSSGVRVLSVFPGRTATPMQAAIHRMEETDYAPERLLQPEDVASVVVNAICLPRTAEVTEIDIRPMQKPQNPPKPS